MRATTDLGKAGITVNGTWSGSVAYEKNSIVNDGADSYISIQDVPIGTALSNTAYWTLLCNGFSSAEVVSAVNAWLVAHPEATTTVQDGAVTTAKLADGAVTDAKLAQDGRVVGLLPLNPVYELLAYGVANTSNGIFSPNAPSDTQKIRIINLDYEPISRYDTISVKYGYEAMVFYYDSSKTYITSVTWNRSAEYSLDTTYAYARFLLRKYLDATIDSIPSDALLLYNKQKEYLANSVQTSVNRAVYESFYSKNIGNANAAYTVRWFLKKPLPKGWLDTVVVYDSTARGVVTVELWSKSGTTYTRLSEDVFGCELGQNTFKLNRATATGTYISFAVSVNGNVRLDSSGKDMWLLRDKVSASFSESSLEVANYAFDGTIYHYSIEEDEGRVYTIGENDNVAEVITEAMKHKDSVVYIEPYTHDCYQEWMDFFGDTYFSSMASGRGIELQNNIHIIGRSGCVLQLHYTGSSDYVQEFFSLFNNPQGGSGYTIENVTFDVSKIRYVFHDERGSDDTPYIVKYSRCRMSQDNSQSTWDNSRACIGGGLGAHGDVTVEDCIFDTVTSEANMDSLAYHNSASAVAESNVVIKNCYCVGNSTLQLAAYGDSTKKTKVLVANCSFGSPIEIFDWSGNENFEIIQINNEIRTT